MFLKNPIEILAEACESESFKAEDLNFKEVEADFVGIFDGDLEELDFDLDYAIEMVNVIEADTRTGSTYLVEMDVLAKYMKSANIDDVSEAISNIAEHNYIDADRMAIVIESDDYAYEMLEEAKKDKKSGSNDKMEKLKKATDFLKDAKDKGVKVVKKKANDVKKLPKDLKKKFKKK